MIFFVLIPSITKPAISFIVHYCKFHVSSSKQNEYPPAIGYKIQIPIIIEIIIILFIIILVCSLSMRFYPFL